MRRRLMTRETLARGLNPEQLEAYEHETGKLCLIAVAGSGKTATVVKSIARRILEGTPAARILAVTFSKKAADEMNERLVQFVGETECRIGTWHSLSLQIVREAPAYKGWKVDDKDIVKMLIKIIVGYKGMNWEDADVTKISQFVSICKANAISHTDRVGMSEILNSTSAMDFEYSRYMEAYSRLQAELKSRRLITFDDMLMFAHQLMCNEQVRRSWASRWDVLYQDEAQDANLVQVKIAEQLTRDHGNYIAVGDLFQAIYGFRGSRPEYLADFAKKAKIVTMHRNYRCGRKIIEAANVVVKDAQVDGMRSAQLSAELSHEGSIRQISSLDLEEEGRSLVDYVKETSAETAYKDVVVLYRTNAQSRALEEALLSAEIPYQVIGGVTFYDRKEVKDLLAYLRLAHAAKDNLFDEDSLRRCINAPFRFLGAAFVDSVIQSISSDEHYFNAVQHAVQKQRIQSRQKASVTAWLTLMKYVESNLDARPSEVLSTIVESTQYIQFLEKSEGEENIDNSHAANVRELIRLSEKYTSTADLLKFIEISQEKIKTQNKEETNRVTLMSIHRSKGLEYPHVFIAGCNEKILPHGKADINEERRLFYVASTRAKQSLVYSSVRMMALRSGVAVVERSRFVDEIFGK